MEAEFSTVIYNDQCRATLEGQFKWCHEGVMFWLKKKKIKVFKFIQY